YPLAAGLLLNVLLKIQAERNAMLRRQEIEQELNRELSTTTQWDELFRKIVRFPASLLPVVGASLYTLAQDNDSLKLDADWRLGKADNNTASSERLPQDACGFSHHADESALHPLANQIQPQPTSTKGFCLPLKHRGQWIGAMHIYLPSSENLTIEHVNMLNGLAPIIAFNIHSFRIHTPLVLQTETIQNERKRIARELHDTLGQNLAYLRLMLDKLTMSGSVHEVATIQQELEQMRDIANEAHEQMRHTLSTLKPEAAATLTELLQATAREVATEAGFELRVSASNALAPLPPIVQRKTHAIFREALYNIQKYAQAKTVQLSIHWEVSTRTLNVNLTDDGIGFDLDQIPSHGHFGLLIMQQRAEEIGGELTIITAPMQGTQVHFKWVAG
ncbi:MAG: sensor histidine kinase, partial [Anaerolineales bacterium]|nr:sensor histidine kinase [Anaerolineales bacterium]